MNLVSPDQFTITPLPRHPGTDPFLLRLELLRALWSSNPWVFAITIRKVAP